MAENEENVSEAQAPEEAAVEETPAEEAAPAEEEAPPAEEAPAAEDAPAADAAADEPEAPLSAKERRRRERSRHSGEALPPRGADERAEERAANRREKARQRSAYRKGARERRRGTAPAAAPPEPAARAAGGRAKVRQGVVVSDRANKTITVRVDMARQHRRYGKIVRTSSTLHAHDESNDAHVGDTVRVIESRPLSRTKRWRLVEVLERAR
jgi:small subunit ribosomal protein S17